MKNRLLTPDAEGYVNTYRFDFSSVSVQLNVKIFESADEEWVDFVLANRMIDGFTHDFDIVIGPVVDDKVYTQFSLFEQGVISKDTLIRELKTYRLADQYLFHTKRALPHLKFVSHYVVRR